MPALGEHVCCQPCRETQFNNMDRTARKIDVCDGREWMWHIIRLEQGTTNVKFLFFWAHEMTDGDLLGKVRHWTKPPDEVSSWSELMKPAHRLIPVSSMCLQNKLHMIKQMPEENDKAYIRLFLSDAKLAYPRAKGEEGKVVSLLKRFTERAFAGHQFRTGRADTLGTAIEIALKKRAQQKKETR